MRRLWLRAFVAFVVMDAALAGGAAAAVALGFTTAHEFGGAIGKAIFVAVVAVGFVAGALLGAILPAALALRRLGWQPTRVAAVVVGAALCVPAFMVVVIGAWAIDGAPVTLAAHFRNVLRFPQSNAALLSVFALGGAIVLSALARRPICHASA